MPTVHVTHPIHCCLCACKVHPPMRLTQHSTHSREHTRCSVAHVAAAECAEQRGVQRPCTYEKLAMTIWGAVRQSPHTHTHIHTTYPPLHSSSIHLFSWNAMGVRASSAPNNSAYCAQMASRRASVDDWDHSRACLLKRKGERGGGLVMQKTKLRSNTASNETVKGYMQR